LSDYTRLVGQSCPSCGVENTPDARFCSACGTSLYRACPACGADQPVSAAFCSSCGAPLQSDARRGVPVDDHEERRVVTVLFADLAGSTALGEQLDPEDVRELQQELFELVHAQVANHGGMTEKFVGDAVLAVFGVPVAHDDDPERAVRAALAVRDRFPDFAAGVHERHGLEVGLRMGVNTGEVVAGREASARGELIVSGDAVNVAARLQQRAEPGQVLVGERTHAATMRSIAYRDGGSEPAKGKSAPVAAWEPLEPFAGPGRRGVEALQAPIIGRDDELAVLRALATRVERDRAPQLVTLFGPAGVGKSRLLLEFVDRLDAARMLIGRCLPYGEGITYWPLAEVAKTHAGILESDASDVALDKLRRAVATATTDDDALAVLEPIAWTIGLQLPGGSLDQRDVVAQLRDAWTRYLAGLGREQLTVLAVEDVHWASEPLLELLEQLVEALEESAVLTVCTARAEFAELRPLWGAGLQNATSLRLAPLTHDEAQALAAALLGAGGLPEETRHDVLERAEGNPFYLEEILHMLIEQGSLARVNGGWAVREPVAQLAIPDSVHGVIAARLDLLDAVSREALRRCSVMGRVFWPAAVGVDEGLIGALARRGLVSESPTSSIAATREFAFKHALTQEVAYATLPRAERRTLHRLVAEWIERVAPTREAETAELVAFHFDQALEHGEQDPEIARRTFELLLRAGEAALARAALASADSLFARAVGRAPDPSARAKAVLGHGRTRLADPDTTDWMEHLLEAQRLANEAGDAATEADALAVLSRGYWVVGRWDDALGASDTAVDVLSHLPESPQLARALGRRAQMAMLRGRANAAALAEEAVAAARRVADPEAEVNARITLYSALGNDGFPPDTGEVREIVVAARRAGDPGEAYRAVGNWVWSSHATRPIREVERDLEILLAEIADLPRIESYNPYVELSIAKLLYLPAGRWDEAEQTLAALGDEPEATAPSRLLWDELVGGLALRRGDRQTADRLLDRFLDEALASLEPQRIVPMAGLVLWRAALDGDEPTLAHLTEAVLAPPDVVWTKASDCSPIVRAVAHARAEDLLARVRDTLVASAGNDPRGHERVAIPLANGLLAHLAGRHDDAVTLLREAGDRERELGRTYYAACIDLDLAGALEAAGDAAGAAEAREHANKVLQALACVNAI
jgi:class 3 adenylate cyclase/tetratricopeptide (TPR) repeat protein